MPKEYGRNRRVGDLMQQELAVLVQRHAQNEKSGLVTISNVDVSPDLKNAKIYFTCLGNNQEIRQVEDNLNEHAGHFRHELAKSLTLRSIPKISFSYDHSLERANRISDLIDSLHPDSRGQGQKR